ncbi:hypothetical protein Plhal710r2_c053g0160731 [Plasmopara halstedii]
MQSAEYLQKYQKNLAEKADKSSRADHQTTAEAKTHTQNGIDDANLAETFLGQSKEHVRLAEDAKYDVNMSVRWIKRLKFEADTIKKSIPNFNAEVDAQVKEMDLAYQELKVAQADNRPLVNFNFRATLAKKPTYATQNFRAARPGYHAHFGIDGHVNSAPESWT